MLWYTRRNQISSFGETSEFIYIGGGLQFSRLLAAEVCASAVVMLYTPCSEVVWRVLATHSIRQFPLHFPSRASPGATTFQLDFPTLYIQQLVYGMLLESCQQPGVPLHCIASAPSWLTNLYPRKAKDKIVTSCIVLFQSVNLPRKKKL